jgi:hypothetical protein
MTVEQQARDMLECIGVENAQNFSAGELVELANMIGEIRTGYKLLEEALNAIPDYMDGRNDKLCNAIEQWLRCNKGT